MKRIERLFRNPKTKPSNPEKILVSLIAFIVVLVISATGTKAGDNQAVVVSQISKTDQSEITNFDDIGLSQPDTLKMKEIYIEMQDGRISKAIVDGKEVPADKLENEDFVIMEKDTSVMKRIVLRNAHPKFNSMVIETNELEWHQKPEDTTKVKVKKIMVNKSGDDNFIFIPVEGKPMTLFEYPDHFADSLTLMWKDLESTLRKSQLFNPDSAGNIFTITEKGFDTMMYMIKSGIEKGIYLDDKTFYSFPGHDDPIHRKEAAEYRKLIEMERELQRLEADASRMKNGAEREALRRETEGKRQEMEARRHEMEARRLEMESRRPELMLRGLEPRIIIGEDIPDLREIELLIDRAAPAPEHGFDRKHLRLLKDELLKEGLASKRSTIIITRKQTIVDGNITEQKNHKRVLKRLEEISGKKLEADQAITIR